jgi:hypothetical protein
MRKFVFLVFILVVFQTAGAEEQKLSQAYEQELIERVKGVFSFQAGAEAAERPICATPIFLEVKANWERLSARTRKMLQQDVERPTYSYTEYTYDTPDGHFKIHYVRDGDNAVYNPHVDQNVNGHPDWVDTVAMVLEHVWDTEITALEYRQPPSDGWYPGTEDNGGDDKYDVYLLNLTGGTPQYLGYTKGELFLPGSLTSATSHIALDNDYIGYVGPIPHTQFEWLEVTAAHEFFHAVQMGYDGAEYEDAPFRPYWMEMSAVWMEEMVYDDVNDYLGYLRFFYDYPEWSLKTFSDDNSDKALHPYGSCVWPIYLSERRYPSVPNGFDNTIIRDIWQRCEEVPGNNAIYNPGGESATDGALAARGASFEEVFREFTVWNYFTGDRARTESYYSEGEDFPQMKVDDLHRHTTYPVFSPSGPNHPENLGSNYVVFVPDAQLDTGGVRIEFNGHEGDFVVSAVGYKSYPHAPFDTSFIGVAKIYDWMAYDEVVMIPAVVTRSPDDYWIYDYQAFHDSSLTGDYIPPEEDRVLQNYPNPFVIKIESDRTFFPFILSSPSRVRIDVFNLSGERIRTIRPQRDITLSREEYTDLASLRELDLFWDGRNEEGEYVSSGVYLYRFRTDRATEVKKIAVIR